MLNDTSALATTNHPTVTVPAPTPHTSSPTLEVSKNQPSSPSQPPQDGYSDAVGQKRSRTSANLDDNPNKNHQHEFPSSTNLNVDSNLPHDECIGLTDDLNMDDFLPDISTGNGGNWLLDDINDAPLNASTQYLELHEPPVDNEPDILPQPFQPHRNEPFEITTVPFSMPPDELMLDSSTQNITTTSSATTINRAMTTTASTTPLPIVNTPPPPTAQPISSQPMQDTISSGPLTSSQWFPNPSAQATPPIDSFSEAQVPEIKTHIILTKDQVHAKNNSLPSSSAVRIAPRDDSKSEQPRASSTSRGRHGLTRKRSRNSTTSASPTTRTAIQNHVSPRHNQSAPNNIHSNQQHIQPPPAPHPMVAPMLFAQGFQQASPQALQKPNFPLSSHPQPQDVTQQNPNKKISPLVPAQAPAPVETATKSGDNSSQQNTPNSHPMVPHGVLPGTPGTPGMMPVDPNILMQMAQQMWYAAMAASGNTPLPQGLPGPNQPPVFNAPPAFVQQQLSQNNIQPQSDTNKSINNKPNIQQNIHVAKSHPVFITDNGKHVIVEQQAPAKLTRHPVLGRLQLQSRHQAALEHANPDVNTQEPTSTRTEQNDNNASTSTSTPASASKDRRKRLVWTPELHDRFVQAISAVGIHQAVPKTLVQIMNVEGLTTEHVKSHLQKYRNSLRKAACDDERDKRKDPNPRLILRPTSDHDSRGAREVRIVPNRALVAATRPIQSATRGPITRYPHVNLPACAPTLLQPQLAVGSPLIASNTPKQNPNPQSPKPKPTEKVEEKPQAEPQVATAPEDENVTNEEIAVLSGTAEQMHERTMQLQYQLQVLVHRTVALQKQLQVKIGENNSSSFQEAESNPNDQQNADNGQNDKEQKEDEKDEERQKMQAEYLDSLRQSQKVRRELGIIQHELGKKNHQQSK